MYLFNIFANIEYYFSETCYVAMASIAAAVLNVILNMIFIKRLGILQPDIPRFSAISFMQPVILYLCGESVKNK